MFYILSLKHTKIDDAFMTLWRPDNSGYCWGLEAAGKYEKPVHDYHDNETNQPIPINDGAVFLNYGMMEGGEVGILNNRENRKILNLEFKKGSLKKNDRK
jgi:hypothetical protein